jgi:hypothetical protein
LCAIGQERIFVLEPAMIHEALDYIRRELSDRLAISDEDVMTDSGRVFLGQNHTRGAYITLVNVGNDPALHELGEPVRQQAMRLKLHVLFSFDFDAYKTSLEHLSNTIALFEEKPVYESAMASATNPFPTGLNSLRFTVCTTSCEELNNLWSVLGGIYLPSVLYEVQVAQAQAAQ